MDEWVGELMGGWVCKWVSKMGEWVDGWISDLVGGWIGGWVNE